MKIKINNTGKFLGILKTGGSNGKKFVHTKYYCLGFFTLSITKFI